MTGSPLVRLGITVLVIVVVGFALARITGGFQQNAIAPPDESIPAEEDVSAPVVVDFQFSATVAPSRIRVDVPGRTVLDFSPDSPESRAAIELAIPPSGVDAVVRAEWDAPTPGSPNALRIRDAVNGELPRDRTAWGSGSVTEVVGFSSPRPAP